MAVLNPGSVPGPLWLSDNIVVAIIAAIASIVTAAISTVGLVLAVRTHSRMSELEKNTNSMKDALVKAVGESEFSKGLRQGTQEAAVIRAAKKLLTSNETNANANANTAP